MKHIEPSKINIINYLSGEMNMEEMNQFELQMESNQSLKEQVEELREVQNQIGVWKNEDLSIPDFEPMTASDSSLQSGGGFGFKKLRLTTWMKYAAAFVGFLLLFQILGFEINRDGNTLMLSYGEPISEQLKAKDIDAIVAKAISTYSEGQNSNLIAFKNEMRDELVAISSVVENVSDHSTSNLSNLEGLFNSNMDRQYVRLESMIRDIEDNQRQELEDSFTSFVEYIENKRVKDQYKIQNAFSEIATAINDQQFQTNALLTSMSDEDPGLKSY